MKNAKLNFDNDFFEIKDVEGNTLYGYLKKNHYVETGANFGGSHFSKIEIGWKRNKKGATSKAFYEWLENIEKEMYSQFYKINNEVLTNVK